MRGGNDVAEERPTLKTIAFLTGLGVTTVSRALKNGPEIGEDTKERVRQIAKQVGYRPNRAGVRLRTGKTNVISLVLNTHEESMGLVSEIVYGITEALAGTPYHLVITSYSLTDPMEPIRYVVETRSADGLIMSHTEANDPRVTYLMDHNFPFATHGRTQMGVTHPWHDYDNEAYAYAAVKMLAERGRKLIALNGPPAHLLYASHMRAGFERAIKDFGLTEFNWTSRDSGADVEHIRQLGLETGKLPNHPDGIVCNAPLSALALVSGLEASGIEIGKHIDVVTKRNSQLLAWFRKDLLTINEDFRAAGRDLAKAVMARIEGADPETLQTLAVPILA
ncbi:MAG: LacI family transcriptional regulator [Rhizobiaceae bacterium]